MSLEHVMDVFQRTLDERTLLSCRSLTRRFFACSFSPAFEDPKTAFELYPKRRMRASGIFVGRNDSSLSQLYFSRPSLETQVKVDFAFDSVLNGLRPWIAMMLSEFFA